MKLFETTVNIGGLLRCMFTTLYKLSPDREVTDGETIKCDFCKQEIVLMHGVWYWKKS